MDSHSRRIYFKRWRASHQQEIAVIIAFVASKHKHYTMSFVTDLGIIEMREVTRLTILNMTKSKEGWQSFLRERGVVDFTAQTKARR